MTEFGSSKIKRQVKIHGVEQPVQAEMTSEGISFWIKGSKKRIALSWFRAVEESSTPADVPSFLMGKPMEFLKNTAAKVAKRRDSQ